jgi:hypothetical protein
MAGKGQNRGPKLKTAANSAPSQSRFDRAPMEPTIRLTLAGRREFRRLVQALVSRGLIGKVDAGHVSLCAALTAELEKAMEVITPLSVSMVTTLASQVRGLKREMGLTIQPSRSITKVTPGSSAGGAFGDWKARTGG